MECLTDEEHNRRQLTQTRSGLTPNGYNSNTNLRGGFARYSQGAMAPPSMTSNIQQLQQQQQIIQQQMIQQQQMRQQQMRQQQGQGWPRQPQPVMPAPQQQGWYGPGN